MGPNQGRFTVADPVFYKFQVYRLQKCYSTFSEAVGMTLKIKQQFLIGISHMWVPRASWVPLLRAEGGKKQLDNTPVVGILPFFKRQVG